MSAPKSSSDKAAPAQYSAPGPDGSSFNKPPQFPLIAPGPLLSISGVKSPQLGVGGAIVPSKP